MVWDVSAETLNREAPFSNHNNLWLSWDLWQDAVDILKDPAWIWAWLDLCGAAPHTQTWEKSLQKTGRAVTSFLFPIQNGPYEQWKQKWSLVSLLVQRRMREVYHERQSDAYILATETVERLLSSKSIFAETSGKNLPISTHRIVIYREPLLFKLLEKIQTNKTEVIWWLFFAKMPTCKQLNLLK